MTIFEFDDVHEYLNFLYSQKKRRNARFSLRGWSKKLGLKGTGSLSMILRRQRQVSLHVACKLARFEKLPEAEASYLQLLTVYSSASTESEKKLYRRVLEKFQSNKDFSILPLEKFNLISEWYHFAIYEMTFLRRFRNDPQWISRRLGHGISPEMVESAIKRLIHLGLLALTQEARLVRRIAAEVSTPDDIASDALKSLHSQMIKNSLPALFDRPVAERHFSSNTICIDLRKLTEAKKAIQNFEGQLTELCRGERGDEVFQFNIQFFKLTAGNPN